MSGRHETPDPTPVAIPVGFRPPPSMQEMIAMYVRRELSQAAGRNDQETFEEADDFDIPDEPPDPSSPWELDFDKISASLPIQGQNGPGAPAPAAPSAGAPPPPQDAAAPEASKA